MAEKLIVEKVYEDDDIPAGNCQIYTISSLGDDTPICSVEPQGLAHAFAAAPLMLEALKDAQEFIYENTPHEYGISEEYTKITKRIAAAIAAAEGE
jgi:hypothetical protein